MRTPEKPYQDLLHRLQAILTDGGCSGDVTAKDIGEYGIVNVGYSIPKKVKQDPLAVTLLNPVSRF